MLCHLVTVMRALGVPTRSVTNYDSAHDTDVSMSIDYHMDEEGEMLNHLNDSVWYVLSALILYLPLMKANYVTCKHWKQLQAATMS